MPPNFINYVALTVALIDSSQSLYIIQYTYIPMGYAAMREYKRPLRAVAVQIQAEFRVLIYMVVLLGLYCIFL